MDFQCTHPNCSNTFYWSGRGVQSKLCPTHRKERDKARLKVYSKEHKLIPPEEIVRPPVSHLFSGPGLFEQLPELINRAITVKSHTLNMPKSWVINNWLHGQAGQQFVKSFMHPGL